MKRKELNYEINDNGCWICTSHKNTNKGYINIRKNGIREDAHRYMYKKYKGEIPEDLIVRHICDQRNCINPDHLILGTHQDNANDKVERNRQTKGVNQKNAILNDEIVKQIKQRALTERSNRILAKEFNISYSTIEKIKAGTRWKHVKI